MNFIRKTYKNTTNHSIPIAWTSPQTNKTNPVMMMNLLLYPATGVPRVPRW